MSSDKIEGLDIPFNTEIKETPIELPLEVKSQFVENMPKPRTSKMLYMILAIVGIVAILAISLSAYNYSKMKEEKWACIAKSCSEYYTPDEWITTFCRPDNNQLMCNVTIENQNLQIPSTSINMSKLNVCKAYTCVANVKVKATDEIINNE